MSGTVLAQAVTLAAVPVLARLYDPHDFGAFGLYTTILSILGGIGCLRYELAIVLPRTRHGGAQVFALAALVAVALSFLVLIAVALWRVELAALFKQPTFRTLLWWMPPSILGLAAYQALNYWATRSSRFKTLSSSQVFRAVAVTATQVGSAGQMAAGGGLVVGQLVGQWVANVTLFRQVVRHDLAVVRTALRPSRMWRQAQRYASFPLHGAPQALLNSVSQAIPVLMLGMYFAPAVVGLYVMTNRVVAAPMTLISQGARQAFMPSFARQLNAGDRLLPPLRRYTLILAGLGLPATVLFALFGGVLFGFVLGERWTEAGHYAGWVGVWLWLGMANVPAITVLTVLERQRTQLIYEIVLLLGRVAALASAAWTHSALTTIALFSVVGAAANGSLVLIGLSAARKHDARLTLTEA
ncbi:oligosaccharide flippase family protein [Bacillus sp. NP157]|nr:oligosaccharide flippase family protein [Bacillus sp. NP157]